MKKILLALTTIISVAAFAQNETVVPASPSPTSPVGYEELNAFDLRDYPQKSHSNSDERMITVEVDENDDYLFSNDDMDALAEKLGVSEESLGNCFEKLPSDKIKIKPVIGGGKFKSPKVCDRITGKKYRVMDDFQTVTPRRLGTTGGVNLTIPFHKLGDLFGL